MATATQLLDTLNVAVRALDDVTARIAELNDRLDSTNEGVEQIMDGVGKAISDSARREAAFTLQKYYDHYHKAVQALQQSGHTGDERHSMADIYAVRRTFSGRSRAACARMLGMGDKRFRKHYDIIAGLVDQAL